MLWRIRGIPYIRIRKKLQNQQYYKLIGLSLIKSVTELIDNIFVFQQLFFLLEKFEIFFVNGKFYTMNSFLLN